MKIIEKYRQAIQQTIQDLHKQACANQWELRRQKINREAQFVKLQRDRAYKMSRASYANLAETLVPSASYDWVHPTSFLLPREGTDGDNSAPTVVHIYLVAVTISGPLGAERRGSWTTERPRESPVEWFINGFGGERGLGRMQISSHVNSLFHLGLHSSDGEGGREGIPLS